MHGSAAVVICRATAAGQAGMTLFIYSPSPLLSNLETNRQESREKATTAPVARLEHSLLVAVGDADPDYANRHAERRATQITPRTECSGCGRLASDWTAVWCFRKHEAQCQRTPAPDKENTAQACRNRSSRAGSKSQHSPVAPLRQPAHVNTSSQHQVGARSSRPARRGR